MTFTAAVTQLVCGALLILAAGATPAHAVISAAHLLDGPSAALEEIGGVAMAPDGTGGVVYRKVDGGRSHIFVAAFNERGWRAPQRVDVGPTQAYASSWPAIGAGNGGRLVAVWVQEFGPADRLFSATLQPGAERFEPPVPVDLNVGDSALGTWPQVAMAGGGQALLSYRVITNAQPGTVPAGNVLGEIRMARLGGQLWSSLGTPVNRNLAGAQPAPTADNRPRVGIDRSGAGVVAWTELDDQFVSRIYMRRVFSSGVSIARQVTPRDAGGVVTKATDAFALAVGPNGEAALAWRQAALQSGLPARVHVAQLADQYAAEAASFGAPRVADGGNEQAPAGVAAPTVSISGSEALVGLSVPSAAQTIEVSELEVAKPERLDKGDAAVSPRTQVSLGTDGSAALAWATGTERRGTVVLRERREDGAGGDRVLTGPRGGGIDDVQLGGSGVGDALVAFTQGTGAARQLVVASIDAAPQTFSVQAPLDWVRAKTVKLAWDPAIHAVGKVKYALVVDDDVVAEDLTRTNYTLATKNLADGLNTVAVVATDSAAQETSSIPATLKIDRRRPKVAIKRSGRRLTVRVSDPRGSGVDAARTAIRFGGAKAKTGRSRRSVKLTRAGRFTVTVKTRDKAGNAVTVRRTVTVR